MREPLPPAQRWSAIAAIAVAGLLCHGCAVLMPTPTRAPAAAPSAPQRRPSVAGAHPALQGLQDARGALELHSRHSHDGTTPIPVIARLAELAGLDFIHITDHGTLAGHAEQRLTGRPLVFVGEELSTTDGHLLALFIANDVAANQPTERVIEQIHAQGGLAIVADPARPEHGWTRWDLPVDGLVIYDLNRALMADGIPWMLAKAAVLPNAVFWQTTRRRPAEALALWDHQLLQGRRLTGISGHDTHAHVGVTPLVVDSFQSGFRFAATHVLVPTLTPAALAENIRRGRCYVGVDGIGDPRPFVFALRHAQGWALMGDHVPWQAGLTAVIQLPRRGTVRLFHNGQALRSTVGTDIQWPIERPGIYRLEVSRKNRPWILSNPIYVDP